jgi:hypothetical protein
MSRHSYCLAVVSLGLLITVGSNAAPPPDSRPVILNNGITTLELEADHIMITLAHRENFNAHSFEVAMFYIRTHAVDSDPKQWQIVPIERKSDDGRWEEGAHVYGGADCQIQTFRLLHDQKQNILYLLVAHRSMEDRTFADPGPVTFEYYKLTFNTEGVIGWPVAYFKLFQTDTVKTEYCDVDKAIKTELGFTAAIAPIP